MLIVLGLLSLQNQPLQPNLKFVELLWKKEFPTLLSPPTVLLAISFLLWFSREFSLHRRRETKSPFSEMEISKVYIYIYLSLSIFSLNPWFIIILKKLANFYTTPCIAAVFNEEHDIGTFTIKTVDDPRTLNKIVYIRPPKNIYSLNDLVDLWEKKIDKTLEKQYLAEEQILKSIQG